MRGDVYELRAPRGARGEQAGTRSAVVVQSDDLMLSTLLVAPTSRSARPQSFRSTVVIDSGPTQVLVKQTVAISPERLGKLVGHVSRAERDDINDALRLALELD